MIRPVRRIVATSFVFAAFAAGGETVAVAASGASTPISKAKAVAFAQAVGLTTSDLPGAGKIEPPPREPTTNTTLFMALRCARPGIVIRRPVDEDASILDDGRSAVVSVVRVMPSEAIAAAQLAAFASRRGHVCFARGTQVEVTSENEPREAAYPIKTTFVPLVKLLGTGAIGVHTLSKLPHTPNSAVFHTGGVLFRVGPAEILFITLGAKQFPPATEGRLLSLLHSRAEAHKLQLHDPAIHRPPVPETQR